MNNDQREVIYAERRKVLNGENLRDSILKMITNLVENIVDMCIPAEQPPEEWDMEELNMTLGQSIPLQLKLSEEQIKALTKDQLKHNLKELAVKLYEAKEAQFAEPEQLRERERVFLLRTIDRKWMDHIDDMDQLRQGIGLASYSQRDPLVEYKMAAYDMFDALIANIQEETVRLLYMAPVQNRVEREQVVKVTATNKDDSGVKAPVKKQEKKIYPNDPCPCGSGKKYKQCCGRKA